MIQKLHRLWLALVITVSLPACATPLRYTAEPMEAQVIDADTKQPLEGVVVVAHWELEHGTVGGNVTTGQLKVMETVTDKDGKFSFPGFGPEVVWNSFLLNYDPRLLLFKSGYRYQVLINEYDSSRELRTHPIRRSEWSGRTIEMKPFRGTLAEYKGHFEDLNSALEYITTDEPKECYWKRIPKMIRAMNQERWRLIAQGANPHTLSSIDKELLMNDKYFTEKGGCGSPKTFFGDIQ